MKKFFILPAFFVAVSSVLLSGCITDPVPHDGPAGGKAAKFATSIAKTRAYDGVWEYGDEIGVYMVFSEDAAEDPIWQSFYPYAENMRYGLDLEADDEPTADVLFSGVDLQNTIMWPGGGRKVDVVAYYPRRATEDISAYTYDIDISDQTSQKDIDLMWSNNLKEVDEGNHTLRFSHTLSKLIFNVTDEAGASLDGMVSTFEGLPTVASYNLATGTLDNVGHPGNGAATFDGYLSPDDDEAVETARVEAIVLPDDDPDDYTVTFKLAGGGQAVFTVTAPAYRAGKRYIYDIVLKPIAGQSASFGTDGSLKTILDWEDVDDDRGPHDIDKNDPDEAAEPWNSGVLHGDSEYYDISGNAVKDGTAYKLPDGGGDMTITMDGVAGIRSVGVSMKSSLKAQTAGAVTIRSVKVGGRNLFYAGGTTYADIPDDAERDYVFRTDGDDLCSGNLVITIEADGGPVYVTGFGYNETEIP